jgi:hypothetical protein
MNLSIIFDTKLIFKTIYKIMNTHKWMGEWIWNL